MRLPINLALADVTLPHGTNCLHCNADLRAGSSALRSATLDSHFCDDNCATDYRAFAAGDPELWPQVAEEVDWPLEPVGA